MIVCSASFVLPAPHAAQGAFHFLPKCYKENVRVRVWSPDRRNLAFTRSVFADDVLDLELNRDLRSWSREPEIEQLRPQIRIFEDFEQLPIFDGRFMKITVPMAQDGSYRSHSSDSGLA